MIWLFYIVGANTKFLCDCVDCADHIKRKIWLSPLLV